MRNIKKILILGSGALKIGEAGEFDYSGSQAIKALREEGIRTVLVNPNIATIQTSKFLADTVYFLPINKFFVEKIIEKEKPNGILLSFGGQTALNCGLELNRSGVLKKYNVEVLGTQISGIKLTEDRHKFAEHLRKINIPVPPSCTATTIKQTLQSAEKIGYPIMVRSSFALGGQGSGIAKDEEELKKIAQTAFSFVKQILVEKYLYHYKEIEYEIVRDKDDNCIAVCNMENMDPLGIHTGESIVIAPSQTLNNFEYHALRDAAIKIVRSLNIIGECNVQYALNPYPQTPKSSDGGQTQPNGEIEYYVIEVNARLSRSSALASKATGYPLAYVAAKLALGKNLTEIKNKVTQITSACFEPALDYVVVKIPRWDINKFKKADEKIGSSMKSVGEVMGIGRRFEESYQKAIRMLDLEIEGATSEFIYNKNKTLKDYLKIPTPKRMFAISQALREKITVEEIYKLTGIDPWFLNRIKYIVDEESSIPKDIKKITKEKLLLLKKIGVSDKRIGELAKTTGLEIRKLRKKLKIIPSVFQIDTLAGEFPAKTNYLYLTYNGQHNDVKPQKKSGVIVLGSGPYRIGSSVEFDWTCVNTAINLRRYNKKSIIVNCNPETVSTDYDISDRLYFEELTFERIADIYDFENPYGVIISVGGQTPNNRAFSLKSYGANILGTDPSNIEIAEDRSKFSKLLDDIDVIQPPWDKFTTEQGALNFVEKVGFPVLIRPSFVLSGTLMRVCYTKEELLNFIKEATLISKEYPITISKFIVYAKEIEFDAVALKGEIKASVISDHVENAGVHSGDATIVLPPQRIYLETQRKIEQIAQKLASALSISGPFNIQYLAKNNEVQVIEINLRASRTLPFISKVTGVDFAALCVDAFFGKNNPALDLKINDFVAVKVAQFSFARLTGADPLLHVEMSSTGEVACFGEDLEEAFLKGELAVGGKIPEKGIFISLGGDENKIRFLDNAKDLAKLNLPIFATEKTAEFLKRNKIKAKVLYKIHEHKPPTLLDYLQKGKIDLAINLVDSHIKKDIDDDYAIRRAAVDNNVPLFTNFRKAELFIRAITRKKISELLIKSWDDYVGNN
ncbi:MAG: carbamoyl phosphate synthase large subunit [Candidatus Levybacteria bacterium CG_4_9_14_3_um_filter_35_16]|nr:MAG: carbamoyl phosphate synthase large subunit [Candidatus Levybacteria bacterium CG_4_9_14_3_um_filter_35_16]PJC54262.1 MAG: carbamoyl phosphate synthase large subunit [Candidatus Levybacteria bacterium CG_4_9_14_0_2_um_filter_35_21]